jgi:hypothetical protein
MLGWPCRAGTRPGGADRAMSPACFWKLKRLQSLRMRRHTLQLCSLLERALLTLFPFLSVIQCCAAPHPYLQFPCPRRLCVKSCVVDLLHSCPCLSYTSCAVPSRVLANRATALRHVACWQSGREAGCGSGRAAIVECHWSAACQCSLGRIWQ